MRCNLRQQTQQAARRGQGQRTPRRIVCGDIPAFQMLHHPPRKPAIGGDDGDAPFGLFQRLAHQQRDCLRFFLDRRAGQQPHTGKTTVGRVEAHPVAARLRGQKQRGNRAAAGRFRRRDPAPVPRLHLRPVDAHPVQQQLQVILRMGDGIIGTEHRAARFTGSARAAQFVPRPGAHLAVEIGQDHRPFGQFGNDAQQPRQRGRGAGDTGSDDRMTRRIVLPAPRSAIEQQVAPGCGIHLAAGGQFGLPADIDPREQADRTLPVLRHAGHAVEHGIGQQIGGFLFLDQQTVHRPRHFAGQIKPRPARQRLHPLARALLGNQAVKRQPAAHRIAGGRNVGRAQRIKRGAQFLVKIEIAHRDHARHQQPALARFARVADEGFGQGARRAARRDEQRQAGKAETRLAVTRHQTGDECIGKPAVRGNRIDQGAGAARLSHAARPPRSGGSPAACRPRTTIRRRTGRTAALRQSRGSTGCWWRTALRAHRAAGGG